MKWNWWKKDNSTLKALKEALDEINSLKCELATKERVIATYSDMYNKVADEVDSLKEQIKEYDELVEEDWAE